MIGIALAIIIYLFTRWYDVWNIIPEEHKFWLGFALILLAISDPTEKVIYREKS